MTIYHLKMSERSSNWNSNILEKLVFLWPHKKVTPGTDNPTITYKCKHIENSNKRSYNQEDG